MAKNTEVHLVDIGDVQEYVDRSIKRAPFGAFASDPEALAEAKRKQAEADRLKEQALKTS